MAELIDKGLLLMMSALLVTGEGGEMTPVVALLLGVVEGALGFCLRGRKRKWILSILFFILCFWVPELYLCLPVAFYDCVKSRNRVGFLGLLPLFILGIQNGGGEQFALLLIFSAAAVVLAVRTGKQERLEDEMIRMRDTSTELNLALEEKNRNLIERQDNEIYLATLKERNRIAREIHDNVGHMLSRSILQVGALQMVYKKEETLREQLGGVNDTLNQAMTSIRESVHDLHDDSIDLEQAMSEIIKPMRESYRITLDYDMGKEVPRNIKYCFLTATREAMSNIVKHSNAKEICITLREHPVLFQLKIEDDGTKEGTFLPAGEVLTSSRGMGLSNMRSRVETLNGTFRVSTEDGFRIFISIPKEKKA